MFDSIRQFFARLFGTTPPPPTMGYEDAGDIPEDVVIQQVPPPEGSVAAETSTRSVGTRSTGSHSVGTRGFEDLGDAAGMQPEAITVTTPRFLWCLDNGHGRLQAGKRSPIWADGTQLEEWKFNRDIVQRMLPKLDKAGVQYFVVVPEDDVDSFLAERVGRANAKESELGLDKLFVSIHANASVPSASGIETWYHVNSSSGIRLASVFQRHIMGALSQHGETHEWRDRGIRTYTPASANFYVLRNTSMGAVLTENGFYTHETECKLLLQPEVQDAIADAHVAAILEIELHGLEGVEIYNPNFRLSPPPS